MKPQGLGGGRSCGCCSPGKEKAESRGRSVKKLGLTDVYKQQNKARACEG